MIEADLSVNGESLSRSVDEKTSLLRFLRDDLGLMGTKEGCSTGDCGTCVVLVDGKPEDACLYNMRRAKGIRVETVESLGGNGRPLHPLQAAFLECGAVQCGFCTPGMLMAAKALLARNPSPSEPEIREALKDVVCRCTGYVQIFEAVQKAADWMARPTGFAEWQPKQGAVGVSAALVDGLASVTGQLAFADDLVRDGMLWGQIVWSEHPYAEITNVDTSAARQAPGWCGFLRRRMFRG